MATPCGTRAFEDYLRCLDGPGEPVAAPASLAGTLRPCQVEGFRWLARLASLGFGGILADEMGLGKTLQMIALVKSLRDSGQLGGSVLVAGPASLVFNWADEFARFALDVPVLRVGGLPSAPRGATIPCDAGDRRRARSRVRGRCGRGRANGWRANRWRFERRCPV